MADCKVLPGPLTGCECLKNAVCINTNQIYDSCKDKDCAEDLRVYLTACGQAILDRAVSVRTRKCEILCCFIDIEQVPFNKGFYTVNVKFFFKCFFDAFFGCGNPQIIEGIASFDKRVILFGSESTAKIFTSKTSMDDFDPHCVHKTKMPQAVVEVVDPIALSCKVVDPCDRCCCGCCDMDITCLHENICNCFDGELVDDPNGNKLFITIGLFSIIRLERDAQLLIPSYDFYIPEKECACGEEEDPCSFFRRISFPTDEFAPPQIQAFDNAISACPCREPEPPCCDPRPENQCRRCR